MAGERLEPRDLLAVVNWINPAGGDWSIAGNWLDDVGVNRLPGPGDDAVINVGGGVMVSHTQNVVNQINSLAAGTPVSLTSGVIQVAATLSSTSTLTIRGGTLRDATVSTGTTVSVAYPGATLDAVTLATGSELAIVSGDGNLTNANIVNGLTVNGHVSLGYLGRLQATGTQAFQGTGELQFTHDTADFRLNQSNMNLTIGANLTVRGGVGTIQNSSGVTNTTLINQGTIVSNTPNVNGGGLTIATNQFTNAPGGDLQVTTANSALRINTGNWLNQSPINLAVGTLNIDAANWSNASSITLSGGTLNLGGSFTRSDLGTFTRTGGTAGVVNLKGVLDNTSDLLALDTAVDGLGTWNILGGRINRGTITTQNGAQLRVSNPGATLDAITLGSGSDLVLTSPDGNISDLTILNGITIDGQVTVNTSGRVFATGTQTFAGQGELLFTPFNVAPLYLNQSNMTLTLGPNLTVRGGLGSIQNFGAASNTSLVNQGTILSNSLNANGGGLSIASTHFTNAASGLLQVANVNSALNIASGTFLNLGEMEATAGRLAITSTGWSNQGMVHIVDGTLNLGGSVSTGDLGTLSRNNGTSGTVNLTGTLNNAGHVLILDTNANSLGTWNLTGGRINGGTVTTRNGAQLVALFPKSTLDGVTLAPGSELLVVGQNGQFSDVYTINGLTVDGRITIGGGGRLFSDGTQVVGGSGEIQFAATSSPAPWFLNQSNMTLTIGSQLLVHGGHGTILNNNNVNNVFPPVIATNTTVINQGTMQADTNGRTMTIDASIGSFQNHGTLQALLGGSMSVLAANWSNHGTLRATQGSALITQNLPLADATGIVTTQTGSSLSIRGQLTGTATVPAQLTPRGTVRFDGPGTLASTQLLEAMSHDKGAVAAGWASNFAFGTLMLANNTVVQFVDTVDNAAGAGPEAVYANSLIVPTATTLDLNGLPFYVRAAQLDGTVTGGSVTLIPDGGALALSEPTPGSISASGQADTWTFFGRAGQRIRAVVSTGGSSTFPPLSPALNHAQVQVLDPQGTVIATATSAASGADAVLAGVDLASDGVYQVRVQAALSQPLSTGNYVLGVWDATVRTQALVLNQIAHGGLASPYAIDQWTFAAVANQQVQFDLLNRELPGLQFELTGPSGYVAFSGLETVSGLVTLPSTGNYAIVVRSAQGAAGAYSFRVNETSQTPLALGVTYPGTVPGSGFAQLFRIDVPDFRPLQIHFDGQSSGDRIEVYARHGAPPTRREYAVRNATVGADHQVAIPYAIPGTWYVLVYADSVPSPSNFTLQVDSPEVSVLNVLPRSLSTSATERLTVQGLGFLPGTQVELLPQDGGAAVVAQQVIVDSTQQVTVTFDLSGAATGVYGLRVTLPGGANSTLAGQVSVANGEAKLETKLILPGEIGRHAIATLYLEYANTGTASMPAPILILGSNDPDDSDRPLLTLDKNRLVQGFWTSSVPDGFANSVQIYAQGNTPGLLQPGERNQVPVYYAGLQQPWDLTDTQTEFAVFVHEAGNPGLVDWPTKEAELKPDWMAADVWAAVYANLQSQIGPTWGDYVQVLSDNAVYLSGLGQLAISVDRLYGFEVSQALATSPIGTLVASIDAALPAPGLSLGFGRSFGNSINDRYQLGPFGRGWNATGQRSLEELADGTVIVHETADAQRRFQPDGRSANKYFSQTGDTGQLLKLPGVGFELTELGGTATRFDTSGRLDRVHDPNGNMVTSGYTAGQLTSLTHSSGASLTIDYNGAGRIASITDSVGRVTSYTYDAANEHLLTVTDPGGTTTFAYSTGQGAAREHALTSVTDPSGVTQFFAYDSRGRLTDTYATGNLHHTTLAYGNEGQVTITDQMGVSAERFFDGNGFVARAEDATGYYVRSQFDDNLRPSQATDASGRSASYSWTRAGAFQSLTDPLNHQTAFAPGGPFNQPQSFTDARGSVTRYSYDVLGNLTATTYADTTVERATYDAAGSLDLLTNRRGQTVDLTVDSAGQVTHETRSDGGFADYTYDARGRLSTAADASGTTTLTYDTADRMTRVEYPNGRWLEYTYDAAGRRTRIEDQSGFVTNYEYDSAGRLVRLRDAANSLVIEYTYDTAGRIVREDKGNGTYSVYGYDSVGRTTSIVHHAPGGAVNSQFLYNYDAAGRRISQQTLDGTWTYSYDLTDQLTHAVFASTNPNIADQDLQYAYDALGNRTRTVLNGTTTDYAANHMNQYPSAGATSFKYDLDGNLIEETGPNGLKRYAYDLFNRLVRVETPQGVWQYEYDVLGNRKAIVENGERTEYLIDPTGLANVVAEYDQIGSVAAQYRLGLGIANRIDPGNDQRFYAYDSLGSTVLITDGTASELNRYTYLPFGETLAALVTVSNPFTFAGAAGVMREGNDLYFMRARFYAPEQGRFTSQDPIRLRGDDFNFYRYSNNTPTQVTDPSGLVVSGVLPCLRLGGALVRDYESHNPSCLYPQPSPDECREHNGIPLPGRDLCYEAIRPKPKPTCRPGNLNYVNGKFVNEVECKTGSWGDDIRLKPKPQPPTKDPGIGGKARGIASEDPNEKFGAAGFGPQAFIAADTPIPYRINFENLGPGSEPTPTQPATAPAQRVVVTDQLSTDLDWDTFEFTEFGFGDTAISLQNAKAYHFQSIPMTFNQQDFIVDVEMSFDATTGQLRVVFQSLEPDSELPPDVLTGFLPPEDGTGRGKGHVAFRVQPKAGLPTGTELRNVALIKFDANDVIATNQIEPQDPSAGTSPDREALNTIDAGLPSSSADPLPATTNTADFLVSWSGADDAGGSGIATYDIFVSEDTGPFTLWQDDTTASSAIFSGQFDHTYSFYSVATDNVGQVEPTPAAGQATTTLQQLSTVSITASDDSASEAGDSGEFTVTLSNLRGTPSTINYSVSGTATSSDDYAPLTGSVTIPANMLSATIEVAGIVDDLLVEADETIVVQLTSTGSSQITIDSLLDQATVTLIDNDTAQITGVFTRGSGWLTAYLEHLTTQDQGDASLGYRISQGESQLLTLPWTNLNQLSIQFSADVSAVIQESSLMLVANLPPATTLPAVDDFDYEPTSQVATWTFAASLPRGKYVAHLMNCDLDGEWTTSVSEISGNGAVGGTFDFFFNVLPGDVNGGTSLSQTVTNADILLAKSVAGLTVTDANYQWRRDVNGTGSSTNADILLVKARANHEINSFAAPEPPASCNPPSMAPIPAVGLPSPASAGRTSRERIFATDWDELWLDLTTEPRHRKSRGAFV